MANAYKITSYSIQPASFFFRCEIRGEEVEVDIPHSWVLALAYRATLTKRRKSVNHIQGRVFAHDPAKAEAPRKGRNR